jgi:predicted HTH transcriptional regulator
MDYFSMFLMTVIIVLIWYAGTGRMAIREDEKEIRRVEKEVEECVALGAGLTEYNQRLQERKEKIKNQIFEMFEENEKITNSDIVKKLDISKTSTVRYLDELEKEGKVQQVGKAGRNVYYKKLQ